MVRKCLRLMMEEMPHLEALLGAVAGNTGFLFIKCEFDEVRQVLKDNFVSSPLRRVFVCVGFRVVCVHVHVGTWRQQQHACLRTTLAMSM